MKVLLINGSPRAKGCTYTALSEVEKTLREEGLETELMHIGKGPIQGCTACMACRQHPGRCILKGDRVTEALEKTREADAFVFGSPVYYASANGAMVAFMDRMFFARGAFAFKPGACVVSARRGGTTAALDQMLKYLTISRMPVVSSQYWPMIHGNTPQEAAQDLEGLQVMRTLGRNMAWLLRCIQAGREAGVPLPREEERVSTNFIR